MSQNPIVPVPVVHELGYFMHYTDLNMYFATVNYVIESVDDLYDHSIVLGGRTFKFKGYQGGLINPKTGKLAFEYVLTWKDALGASKCTFFIKPMFGPGTKTKKGKVSNVPYIGTQVEVKSSFIEPDEARTFFEAFLLHIDAGRFIPLLDLDRSTIYQGAVHDRYHEQHEPAVINMLHKIEEENNTLGDVELAKKKIAGKWDMFYLHEPDLSVCGIHTKWVLGVKSYRIKEFWKRKPTDTLYHPKFEVFLHDSEKPSLRQYKEFIKEMRDTLIKLLSFVGPLEYVSDMYFDAEHLIEYRNPLPKWDYENIQPAEPEEFNLWHQPQKSLSVLAFVASQPEGCTEARFIGESLDIPERTLRRHINYWINLGILAKKKSRYLLVGFESKSLWKHLKEPILQVCSFLDISFKRIYGKVFLNPDIVDRFRKRKSDQKPVLLSSNSKKEWIYVDNHKQASEIRKQLKEDGVLHLFGIGVHSFKFNERHGPKIYSDFNPARYKNLLSLKDRQTLARQEFARRA